MRRLNSFMNISIVTNTSCNLRCDHCYLDSEQLKVRTQMTKETYKESYKKGLELSIIDKNVNSFFVEVLGGEITKMPYEFWEEMLEWSVSEHKRILDTYGIYGTLVFCTNMVFRDKRYIDLLNKYATNRHFELFISWEPDTNRYGKNNKFYKLYKENLDKTHVQRMVQISTVNLVPTKTLFSIPVTELYNDILKPNGFNDFSNDMLYPYGSGRKFFEENQPTMDEVSNWYIDLHKNKPDDFTISPTDEIFGSLKAGKPFHNMGNDRVSPEIDPEGKVTLNANMSGSELSANPVMELDIYDPLFAIKLLFENSSEIEKKLGLKKDYCDQCKYLRYCNGGYYDYKSMPDEDIAPYTQKDCIGFKKVWDYCRDLYETDKDLVTNLNHKNEVKKIIKSTNENNDTIFVSENDISKDGYDNYMISLKETKNLVIDVDILYCKSISQRLWFYDSLGINIKFSENILSTKITPNIIENIIYGNYQHSQVDNSIILPWVENNKEEIISQRIKESNEILFNTIEINNIQEYTITNSNMVVDSRNDELFRWVLLNMSKNNNNIISLSEKSCNLIDKIKDYVSKENFLRQSK